ncbi:8590_t:CDS:2 [Cetraspora pellucida]|uniref:8590_t:CDS:1 n=1 Tax=Cetraspora pellucida TaxID=1433469 RepID=A0ACA9KZY0_9GLOM|nr:8590_t:CDS:2 [Cetraspora pellucida]
MLLESGVEFTPRKNVVPYDETKPAEGNEDAILEINDDRKDESKVFIVKLEEKDKLKKNNNLKEDLFESIKRPFNQTQIEKVMPI